MPIKINVKAGQQAAATSKPVQPQPKVTGQAHITTTEALTHSQEVGQPKAKTAPAPAQGVLAEDLSGSTAETVQATPEVIARMATLADRLGLLYDQIEAINKNPIFAEYTKVKGELDTLVNALNSAEIAVDVEGTHYLVEYSSCAKSPAKILNLPALATLIGQEAFMSVATVPVTAAKKYLTGKQLEEVCAPESYTKNRKMKVTYKG